MDKLMILPANDATGIRLVRIPDDVEQHEAYRHVVGLIAEVQEDNPGYELEDLLAVLDEHGYLPLEFTLGPHLN